MSNTRAVIILDGHIKSALAAVRSLGQQHIPVWCGAERNTAMACHSRYVTESFVYTSPLVDREKFIKELTAIARTCGEKPVVYAFSDATYLTLFNAQDVLKDVVTLFFPSSRSVEIAFDKGATYSEARVHGVPTILSHMLENREEVRRLAVTLTYPAVIKTRHSVTWHNGRGVSGTASFVQDGKELEARFFAIKDQTGEAPLIQPFVAGEEYGVEMMCQEGKVLTETVHHRLRSMSPTGGASVLKETIGESVLVSEMREHAKTLVRILSWNGPCMVEFKVDADTRFVKLMEINGRFWGSLPLAIEAEIDFPYLYYALANGSPLPATRSEARAGVTTRHFLGDVRHLLRVWFSRDEMRIRLYPKRIQALKDFFSNPKGTKQDVWSWRDPMPSLWQYVDVFKR